MNSISQSKIENLILDLRGMKVMLASDLALLYEVELKQLNQQVQRNLERFPDDFMFQLTIEEVHQLGRKVMTSRYLPYAFTENGVAMLSSVLRSPQAIQVNISIMRTFTRIRGHFMMALDFEDEFKQMKSDTNKMFKIVFERLDTFEEILEESLEPKLSPRRKKIGLK